MELVHRSCPICEASCGLVLEVDRGARRVVSIRGDDDDPRSRGYVCPKSQAIAAIHEDPDRIRRPLRRTGPPDDPHWEEIEWDEALELVTKRLLALRAQHGPDSVGVYIGNPTGHDFGAMLYTTFFMQALGTQRMFSGATVDQQPKNVSCRLMYGDGWLFPIPDIDRTDLLVVLGANPAVSNGSLMSAPNIRDRLRDHRARGKRVIVIDPRRTETAELADEHLFLRPGTDAHLLLALVHVLFEEGLAAPGRLAQLTDGIDQVRALALPFTPEAVAPHTGIAAARIRELARELARTPRAVLYGRFGTCTQEFGTLASWLVDVVNILTGNFDRPGGLMFPRAATGQTEPIAGDTGPMPHDRYRSRVRGFPEVDGQLPAAVMAEEIDSAGEDRVRAMITVAGNPVLTTPNGVRLARALGQLDFMVAIDIYRNETTRYADVILPTTTHLEHENFDFLFQTTSVRNMVRFSPRTFAPPPGAKHHWELLLEIAARLNGTTAEALDELMLGAMAGMFTGRPGTAGEHVTAEDARARLGKEYGPARLLDLMLRAGPYGDGFEDDAPGLSLAKLRETKHAIDLGPLEPRLPELLRTPNRRIDLAPALIVSDVARLAHALASPPAHDGLVLIGRRQVRNMNSWLHNVEVLARGRDRCTLRIHPEDARARGIVHGARARVRSRVGEIVVPVEVSDEMMPGVVCLPHGFGHGGAGTRLTVASGLQAGASFNDLADEQALDAISGNAVLNGIPVEAMPLEATPGRA